MPANNLSYAALWLALTWSCGGSEGTPAPAAAAGSAGAASTTPTGGTTANPSPSPTAGNGGAGVNMPQAGTSSAGSPATGGRAGATPVMPIPVGETPEAKWLNVTGTLAGMPSECGNLGRVSARVHRRARGACTNLRQDNRQARFNPEWAPATR